MTAVSASPRPAPLSAPSPARRILAVAFPQLAIDRIRRRDASSPSGAPDERPLAIVERDGGLLRLASVDAGAASRGCAPGLPLAQARIVCPELRVEPADEHADGRLLDRVADWCDRYTPLVALDPPHGLLLDVSGCAHFFGGEAALLADLLGALGSHGLTVRGAVADAAGAARALAWFSGGGVSAPGEEALQVAALPVAALGLPEAARLGVFRAGLKTVGDLAARDRGELAARFGKAMVRSLDEALGRSRPPISPRRPAPVRVVERRFAEPIGHAEAALSVLRALGDALVRRLELAGEGLRLAEAAFFRADGRVSRLAVGTGAPTRDPELLLRLFRERMDALADPLDPGFGYDLIRLSAVAVEPLAPQARSFDPREDEAAELGALVDRLAARHGRRRVVRFAFRDVHRPEAEAFAHPAQELPDEPPVAPLPRIPGEPPRRPLRLFARPEPIEVLAEVPDGPPVRFVWRRATHRVVRAEGPERIALEWWRAGPMPPTRDYFRVEDEAGARFWLFRDGFYGRETDRPRWFLHGLFA